MIEVSVALVFVAIIARDCFRTWVKRLDTETFQGKQIELLRERLTKHEADVKAGAENDRSMIKMLAEDWAKKFGQLEAGNTEMRKHIDTQVAGTIAQLPNTGRGFGR